MSEDISGTIEEVTGPEAEKNDQTTISQYSSRDEARKHLSTTLTENHIWNDSSIDITDIYVGHSNYLFVLTDGVNKAIAKLSNDVSENNIDNEYRALTFLKGKLDFIPACIFYDGRVLIQEYVGEEIPEPSEENIALLGRNVAKLNSIGIDEFNGFFEQNYPETERISTVQERLWRIYTWKV